MRSSGASTTWRPAEALCSPLFTTSRPLCRPRTSWLPSILPLNMGNILAQDSGGLMKPRDRVFTALHHETPDRCPMQVSFTPEFADRLRADLHIQGTSQHNPHGAGNTYKLE